MSKKLTHEKEIEKARRDRKWKTVITLVSSLNIKNAGGALNSEEIELSCCFYLGEAELDHALDKHITDISKPHCINILEDDLKQAFSYLSAAATASKKSKLKHPNFYQDSHLLLSKYHFIVGNYELCIEYVTNIELMHIDSLSKRGKIILAEALTCKGLSMEELNKDSPTGKDILEAYEKAGEIALSICIEEERPNTLKRSSNPSYNFQPLPPLLEACLLRPGELLISNGLIEDAIQNYRRLLRAVETKATFNIRKAASRKLAEVILSCISTSVYHPPSSYQTDVIARSGSVNMATPNRASPDILNSSNSLKFSKRNSGALGDSSFSPNDEVEEAVLLLLISEAMLAKNAVAKQTINERKEKQIILNETNVTLDLLVFALTRRDQYSLLSQSMEKVMKLAFDEFNLWYQFGLSLSCAGKYTRALLIFEQCLKLCPDKVDVLMLCVKLCINNLQQYKDGIAYAEKVLERASDRYIKASARLAIGVCYNYLALKANSSGEIQKFLKFSINSLNKAYELDSNDTDIMFHLALNQALSKQISTSINTIQDSLAIDPTALTSLYLLVLLLSAQKRHRDALDILETATEEYPHEFGLQLMKVKLTEECHGSQAALVVCHRMLLLWNNLCNASINIMSEVDGVPPEITKSPSFSMSLPKQNLNDSKLLETTASLKKISLPDGTSINDDDTGSIAASIYMEKALSEAASAATAMANYSISTAIALLSKLWLLTAECFINLGDTTEASGCILEASAIFPLSPDVLYMRGRLNELQNNMVEARACFESALSVLPTHKAAMQRLGLIYHDEGDYVLGEKTLRCCILQDASNHTAWNDLGLVLESSGRHNEAADCFMTSLELEMTSPILPFSTIPRLFKAFDTT